MKKNVKLVHIPGVQIALGTALRYFKWQEQEQEAQDYQDVGIASIQALVQNAQPSRPIEARVIAIHALGISISNFSPHAVCEVLSTYIQALNDYTITERGDVGSLVRIEALRAMRKFWSLAIVFEDAEKLARRCYLSVLTLALGKLDKVRIEAALTLQVAGDHYRWQYPR